MLSDEHLSLRREVRFLVLLLVGVGFIFGIYAIATTTPTSDSLYPKCVTYTTTGLHCPGCGTGRAAHFLLTGRPLAALRCNLFAPVFLPFLVVVGFRALVVWAFRLPEPKRRLVRPVWYWLLAGSLILYTVARNIPVEPFCRLAPMELGYRSQLVTPSIHVG